jgi:L-serine/L-threonine ammonia-lyase
MALHSNDDEEKMITPHQFYVTTPMLKSEPLTKLLHNSGIQRDVYIKLDNLQRSGSYKDRGMATFLTHMCFDITPFDEIVDDDYKLYKYTKQRITNVVCSSGGNAGLAAATVANDLQLHCTVVVPITTKVMVIEKLKSLGTNVIVTGNNWNEADKVAQKMVQDDNENKTLYVPPYDHPLLWTGISSIIQEIYTGESFSKFEGKLPSTIILSVGGGGLLCGVVEGLQKLHHRDKTIRNHMPNIICAETEGAASFNVSWNANTIVPLQEITSIATSLGALSITPSALQRAKDYQTLCNCTVSSALCTDAETVDACLKVRVTNRNSLDNDLTFLLYSFIYILHVLPVHN